MTTLNFCAACGARTQVRIPPGDSRPRRVCPQCGTIHYENPRLVVGCLVEHEGRILMCRRAIEPRRGHWTLPAGFLENGETLEQGAARECQEEALANVEIGSLLLIANVTQAHQVHVFFRARLADGSYGVGPESLETRLMEPGELPWDDLAFPSNREALEFFLEERRAGREGHRLVHLERRFGA